MSRKKGLGGACHSFCSYCDSAECSLYLGHFCHSSPHDCGSHSRQEKLDIVERWSI